ncbi:MAG: hypothetical protein JRJ49_10715 [Deltaproteobacteria bacterium]|nr:hypothetical protein [Deltaproteobacteria bacterium]
MGLSEFAIKLLLLFLPGIICSYIVDTFTNHEKRTQFQFIINSYVYGLLSYIVYYLIFILINHKESKIYFLKALIDSKSDISYEEIISVCIVSIALAVIFTCMHNYKLHFNLFKKLKITKKSGHIDVWGYFMNSPDVSWISVRDIENNLIYDGYLSAFSDSFKDAEILLWNVCVYKNDTAELLYKVKYQYLSLDKSKIIIEVREEKNEE